MLHAIERPQPQSFGSALNAPTEPRSAAVAICTLYRDQQDHVYPRPGSGVLIGPRQVLTTMHTCARQNIDRIIIARSDEPLSAALSPRVMVLQCNGRVFHERDFASMRLGPVQPAYAEPLVLLTLDREIASHQACLYPRLEPFAPPSFPVSFFGAGRALAANLLRQAAVRVAEGGIDRTWCAPFLRVQLETPGELFVGGDSGGPVLEAHPNHPILRGVLVSSEASEPGLGYARKLDPMSIEWIKYSSELVH